MAAILQSFQQTFGAGLFGGLLAIGMYGLTTSQTYLYFVEYPKDETWTRILVWALWALNTVHTALLVHLIYHYFIVNAFNAFELSQNVWSLPSSMVVHLIIAFLVMIYFLGVIFLFCTRKLRWWLAIPNVCAILLHIGFGIESIIHVFSTHSLVQVPVFTKTAFLPMVASQAAADIVLASSLCFVLHDHRTSFRSTNSILHTLMIYAINRCLLTTGVAVCSLLMIGLKPASMIYIGPEFLFAGLYTNALLTSLNSRRRIRDTPSSDYNSMQLSDIPSDVMAMESQNNRASHRVDVAAMSPKTGSYDGVNSVDDLKQAMAIV
ncbi:hypothetical protein C8F04DRAFT_1103942 [Mycena alexandri]|uniref:DUF6534 domain-containing protein n=1 Tax=Mycena alexandri TaxID=1745969 RepID=A0AAD6SV84_9AGAR|nr:hypothetical protein C8F04DRAFT_1103942 [Mycena alexandri]